MEKLRSASRYHAVCVSAEPLISRIDCTPRRISLGGEGNALYPLLSSLLLYCREKQAELQVIQDKLIAQMQQQTSNEDARISAAIAEREAQKAAEEAEKEAKRAKMLESIKEHRSEQVRSADALS